MVNGEEEEGPAGLREPDRHWALRVKEGRCRERVGREEKEEGRKEGREAREGGKRKKKRERKKRKEERQGGRRKMAKPESELDLVSTSQCILSSSLSPPPGSLFSNQSLSLVLSLNVDLGVTGLC